MTVDGSGNITNMASRSGSASIATAAGRPNPPYLETGFNGMPGVGIGVLAGSDAGLPMGKGNAHIAAVFRNEDTGGNFRSILSYGGGGGGVRDSRILFNVGGQDYAGWSAGGDVIGPGIGTTHRVYSTRILPSSGVVEVQFGVDGTYSSNSANVDINTVSSLLEIGNWGGYGDYFYGTWGEIIVLGYAPTDDDRARIDGYLAWRWGLQGNLPAGHPYKTAAPTKAGYIASAAISLGALGSSAGATLPLKAAASIPIGIIAASGAAGASVRGEASIALGPIGTTAGAAVRIIASTSGSIGPIALLFMAGVKVRAAGAITLDPIFTVSAATASVGANATVTLGAVEVAAAGASQSANGGVVAAVLGPVGLGSAGQLPVRAEATLGIGSIAISSGSASPVAGAASMPLGAISTGGGAVLRLGGQTMLSLGQIAMSSVGTTSIADFLMPARFRTARASARQRMIGAPARARIIYIKEPRAC